MLDLLVFEYSLIVRSSDQWMLVILRVQYCANLLCKVGSVFSLNRHKGVIILLVELTIRQHPEPSCNESEKALII